MNELPRIKSNDWDDMTWPDWVPPDVQAKLRAYYSGERGPENWVSGWARHTTIPFGDVVQLKTFTTDPPEARGRFVYYHTNVAWVIKDETYTEVQFAVQPWNPRAAKDQVYLCGACGRLSKDLLGYEKQQDTWDESCISNAVLVYIDSIRRDPASGRITEAKAVRPDDPPIGPVKAEAPPPEPPAPQIGPKTPRQEVLRPSEGVQQILVSWAPGEDAPTITPKHFDGRKSFELAGILAGLFAQAYALAKKWVQEEQDP